MSEPGPDIVEAAPQRRTRRRILALTALIVVGLDVASKVVAVAQLSGRAPLDVVDGVLRLTLTRNAGAAFGLATGATALLTVVALAVVALIARAAPRLRSRGWALSLGLLLGGALGNLVDRLLRAPGPFRGEVVDFLDLDFPPLQGFPVFNLADSAICVGGALAVLLTLRGVEVDGGRRG